MNDREKILKGISDDILEQLHRIMASEIGVNQKVGINTLSGSNLDKDLQTETFYNANEGTINIMFNHYIVYIEWDRPPGIFPNVDAIMKWCERKNIRPSAFNVKTLKQLAWKLSFSIYKKGWKKRIIAGLNRDYNGISPLDEYIDKMWEQKWADELFDEIIKELDNYFND